MSSFDPTQHPRGADGQFAPTTHVDGDVDLAVHDWEPSGTSSTVARLTAFERGVSDSMFDLDPGRDLSLTDDQRAQMAREAEASVLDRANDLLAPYGATLYGDGEMLADLNAPIWDVRSDESRWDDLREELGMIDTGDVVETWAGREADAQVATVPDMTSGSSTKGLVLPVDADADGRWDDLDEESSDFSDTGIGFPLSEDEAEWDRLADDSLRGASFERVGEWVQHGSAVFAPVRRLDPDTPTVS